MKVEKINDSKVKITLTFEELEIRKISLTDIEKDAVIAKNLFLDIIEESNIAEEFDFEDSQLFIEASSDNNNLFIVTITKVDNIPDIKKYSLLDNKIKSDKSKNKKTYNKNVYKVGSTIYEFNNLNTILDMCNNCKSENLFFGRNSLYNYNNKYFLIFNPSSVKNKKFLKTFVFLSEYCSDYYSNGIFATSIIEKANLIILNKALQKLSKI